MSIGGMGTVVGFIFHPSILIDSLKCGFCTE